MAKLIVTFFGILDVLKFFAKLLQNALMCRQTILEHLFQKSDQVLFAASSKGSFLDNIFIERL
mgnify:CR=1 FL=1